MNQKLQSKHASTRARKRAPRRARVTRVFCYSGFCYEGKLLLEISLEANEGMLVECTFLSEPQKALRRGISGAFLEPLVRLCQLSAEKCPGFLQNGLGTVVSHSSTCRSNQTPESALASCLGWEAVCSGNSPGAKTNKAGFFPCKVQLLAHTRAFHTVY